MSTVLSRLIKLQAENVIPEVLVALFVIYLLAVIVTLSSVWKVCQSFGARFFWGLLVVGVPFVGTVAHCLQCLIRADLTAFKQFGFFSRKGI